jgi:NADP-dependent 3-hydroxy acid dehydrogenase YdfG
MVAANIFGVLYCTHAALPLMREQGGGHIVNVSSVAGRHANAGSAVYNLTKFGVTAFSEALRQEALHADIRVTCVEPGFVATELQGHNVNPIVQEGIAQMREQMGGDVLTAEDIADAIVYTVSRPRHVAVNELLIRPARQQR